MFLSKPVPNLFRFHNLLKYRTFFPNFGVEQSCFGSCPPFRLWPWPAAAWLRPYPGGSTARLPGWMIVALCLIAGVCEESDFDGGGNVPQPPSVTADIAVAPAELSEDAVGESATVTVELSQAAIGELTLYLTTGGQAIAGGDYDLSATELTIPVGETSAVAVLTPIPDFVEEGAERVEVRIEAIVSDASEEEVAIDEPAVASLTILDAGPFPNAKASVAPDLIAIAGDMRIEEDRIRLSPLVYNWGGAASIPTNLDLYISDRPRWTQSDFWGRSRVPAIDPKGGVEMTFHLLLNQLNPGRHYYILVRVEPIASERPNRGWTNQDFQGFSLNDAGRVVLGCRPPATDRTSLGVADPLAAEQWHLVNNRQSAFARRGGTPGEDLGMAATLTAGPTGRGVKLAVADTGLEVCHPDLAANVEPGASHNFNTGYWAGARRADPYEPSTFGDHGTSVAGIAAAVADNGVGGRGVAPDVLLRGYNYLDAFDWQGALPDSLGGSRANPNSTDVDVFNLSFGRLEAEDNPHPDFHVGLLRNGVRNLRQGRGAIYVKSAGNGFNSCRSLQRSVNEQIGCASANGDALNNLPYLLVVGSFNAAGERASYASAGANLWVTAPSGEYGGGDPAIITTDQMGRGRGYDTLVEVGLALNYSLNPDGNYVSTFNGTSAATPAVSGAVALLLEAHPQLTWRDVKHILAKTARKIDPDIRQVRYGFGDVGYTLQLPWVTNAAGYNFHNWYGFGAVNVDAALAFAASHQPDSLGEFQETGAFRSAPAVPIPDHDGGGLTATMNVSGLPSDANIEAVTLEIDLSHPFTNDLGIHLISPSGTESVLNPAFNEALAGDRDLNWQLLSNAFYGETPNGEWQLKVVDAAPSDAGHLNHWALRFALGTHPYATGQQ